MLHSNNKAQHLLTLFSHDTIFLWLLDADKNEHQKNTKSFCKKDFLYDWKTWTHPYMSLHLVGEDNISLKTKSVIFIQYMCEHVYLCMC